MGFPRKWFIRVFGVFGAITAACRARFGTHAIIHIHRGGDAMAIGSARRHPKRGEQLTRYRDTHYVLQLRALSRQCPSHD